MPDNLLPQQMVDVAMYMQGLREMDRQLDKIEGGAKLGQGERACIKRPIPVHSDDVHDDRLLGYMVPGEHGWTFSQEGI